MNNSSPTLDGLERGRLQGTPTPGKRISYGEALETLTALYRQMGLPETASTRAAQADLKMEYGCLALAA